MSFTADLSNKKLQFANLSHLRNYPEKYIDQTETPEGFKAIPKDDIKDWQGNICDHCEWRKECQLNASVPCMSYARKDGIGVLFKKK